MHLPNIFDKKSNRTKSDAQSEDDDYDSTAPIHESVNLTDRADDGWRRVIQSKSSSQKAGNISYNRTARPGIKAAAMGFRTSDIKRTTKDDDMEQLNKKVDDGWKRAMKTGERTKDSHAPKANIRSAAFGITSLDSGSVLSKKDQSSEENYSKKIQEGMKRSKQMKGTVPENEVHKHNKVRPGIMAAAMGIKSLDEPGTIFAASSDSLYADEVEKKLEDGMKRANKMKGMAPETESHKTSKPRHSIMAAATGIKSFDDPTLVSRSSDSLYSEDVEKKLEDGMKRANKMKGIAPETESHKASKQRHSIMAAATGIKSLDDQNSLAGSSNSLLYDEAEQKAAEGMRRAQQMRGAVPESESHKPAKTRRGIRAAAAGIANIDDLDSHSGSSDSFNSESIERKLDDGMKRANQMKSAMPESETHKTASVRPGIMAAAIGIKPLNDPSGLTRSESESLDDLDKKGEEAMLRTKNMKGAEKDHHSRSRVRANVLSGPAASQSTQKENQPDEAETSKLGELEKMESFSQGKQRRESFASQKKQSFTEGQNRSPRRGSIFQAAIGSGPII